MTRPTDEELNAAIAGLQSMIADPWDKRTWEGAASKLGNGVAAINALRAQLAEVQAELVRRVDMHECAMAERDDATLYGAEQKARADKAEANLTFMTANRNKWQDSATQRWFRIEEANARAERADAALAAQIDADAGLLQAVADNWDCGCDRRYCRCAELAEQWGIAADEIRAQPHDRTALDRMLAEARAQALREAADKVDAIIRAAEEATLDERKEGLRDAHNAITRMIEGGK